MNSRPAYHFPWTRYPAFRLAVLFAAGIAFTEIYRIPLVLSGTAFAICWFLRWMCDYHFRKYLKVWSHSLSLIFYLLLVVLWGGLWNGLETNRQLHRLERQKVLQGFYGEEISVKGEVISLVRSGSGRRGMDLLVKESLLDGYEWSEPWHIRLYGDESKTEEWRVEAGQLIEADIRLQELSEPSNPHEFDYRGYLFRQGIYQQGELLQVRSATTGRSFLSWNLIRTPVHKNIERLFDKETVALAKALVTGYKEELDSVSREQFARSGLSHIMAVSGMHVGFVIAPFWFVMPWLKRFRYGKATGLLLCLLLLFSYAGLTGFSASVCRASVMMGFLSVSRFGNISTDGLNLLGVSALLLLLIDPDQLFDIGFQLSFSAVIVILVCMPVFRKTVPKVLRFGKTEKILSLFLVSVVVQAGLLPLLLFYFNEYSIIGPAANVFALPLLSFSIPFSLMSVGIVEMLPEALTLLRPLNILPVKLIREIAIFFGSGDAGWIEGRLASGWILAIWTTGIAFVGSVFLPKVRWKLLTLFLLTMSLYNLTLVSDKMTPARMKMVLFDIGQGDAIYIQSPGGKNLLIDTGRWSPMGNSGESTLLPFFVSEGIDRLHAVILSHPHADHIGGLTALMEHMEIETIYSNGFPHDSGLYKSYREIAAQKKIPEVVVRTGDTIDIDPSLRLFVLGPGEAGSVSDPNNQSVVLKVVYNRQSFLFTGDAGMDQEARIHAVFGDFLQAGFLKIGHHGSRTSSGSSFLQTVSPVISAASLSFGNRFGHPHSEAVKRIGRFSGDLLFTSLNGALVFETDGRSLKQVDWRPVQER